LRKISGFIWSNFSLTSQVVGKTSKKTKSFGEKIVSWQKNLSFEWFVILNQNNTKSFGAFKTGQGKSRKKTKSFGGKIDLRKKSLSF